MRIVALLSSFLLASVATAQVTYFVDAVNGSDANPGTSRALAFQSISFGAGVLIDNDTLIVLPGTYSPLMTGESYPIQLGTSSTATQNNVKIVGEGGPAVTILDGEQNMTSVGVPIMRFRWEADGASVSGLTFQNTGSADYWSMCIRLGSTSGANFAARNVKVFGNVFTNVHRAIVVFGTDPANSNQSSGIEIHDNLVDTTTGRPFAMWGDGTNYIYNNTIVGPGHDGIWVSSLFGQTSATLVANNIVVNGAVGGIAADAPGFTATYANNNAFNNFTNYSGLTPGPSNTSVDPLFVGAPDYHLAPGSPMAQTGSLAGLPTVRVDLDNFSRRHDSDGDGVAQIDKGAYQFTLLGVTLTGTWAPGQTVNFNFTGPSGGALLLFATRPGALPFLSWGVFAIDITSLIVSQTVGAVPLSVPVTIPNDPSLLGARLVTQGGYISPPFIHLLNVIERTF